jgi:probable lipoprotein (TIGR04455 family)
MDFLKTSINLDWGIRNMVCLKRVIILFLLEWFVACSSVQYTKESQSFPEDLKSLKRITLVSGSKNLSKEESSVILDLARNELSHHSLYINYKNPEKFKGVCSNSFPKIEGVMVLYLDQEVTGNKLNLSLLAALTHCKSGTVTWYGRARDRFKNDGSENQSLMKTYVEKYGNSIGTKVSPYYLIIKELFSELKSPVLSKEEEDEKIEIESE